MLHPFTKRLQNTHNCTHFIHSSPVNCRHAIAPPRTLTPLRHSARHVSVNSRRTDRLPLPLYPPPSILLPLCLWLLLCIRFLLGASSSASSFVRVSSSVIASTLSLSRPLSLSLSQCPFQCPFAIAFTFPFCPVKWLPPLPLFSLFPSLAFLCFLCELPSREARPQLRLQLQLLRCLCFCSLPCWLGLPSLSLFFILFLLPLPLSLLLSYCFYCCLL